MSQSTFTPPDFVSGDKPWSIGVTWLAVDQEKLVITGKVTIAEKFQGPPGYVHGGASAAILDEAMGVAAWGTGNKAVAASITINLHKPVPLNTPLEITGWITDTHGRVIHTAAKICLADGTILVDSTGVFVKADYMFEVESEEDSTFPRFEGEGEGDGG